MKKSLILATLLLASNSAFASSFRDITKQYTLPEDMKGCKVYYLVSGLMEKNLYTIQCPKSDVSVSYREGKSDVHISKEDLKLDYVDIDGVRYYREKIK